MTHFRVNDVPSQPSVLDITDEDIETTGYTSAVGTLFAPDGTTVTLTGATFTIGTVTDGEGDADPAITVVWGTVSPFAAAGLYQLRVVLKGTGNLQLELPYFPIIVEQEDGWLTISSLRRNWRDAPLDDEDVYELLFLSKNAVGAFAPALDADEVVPAHYRKGQRMQARNTWNAAKVDPSSGSFGDETFVIRPVPLDWAVKQVLRPKPAVPPVG